MLACSNKEQKMLQHIKFQFLLVISCYIYGIYSLEYLKPWEFCWLDYYKSEIRQSMLINLNCCA